MTRRPNVRSQTLAVVATLLLTFSPAVARADCAADIAVAGGAVGGLIARSFAAYAVCFPDAGAPVPPAGACTTQLVVAAGGVTWAAWTVATMICSCNMPAPAWLCPLIGALPAPLPPGGGGGGGVPGPALPK